MFRIILSIVLALSTFSFPIGCSEDPFDQMLEAYEKYGGDKYMIDEEIVQGSHVLQAAYLAKLAGAPEDVVVGLLFHDIGQVIDPAKVGQVEYLHASHDDVGGRWLKQNGFPQDVVDFVRLHTLAKVVLCMEDPSYYTHLSKASQISYEIQKRKYLEEEEGRKTLHVFNSHPRREDFLRQRKCDDMAKIAGFTVKSNQSSEDTVFNVVLPSFESYRAMTHRVIHGEGRPAKDDHWRENVDILHAFMCRDRAGFEAAIRSVPFLSLP